MSGMCDEWLCNSPDGLTDHRSADRAPQFRPRKRAASLSLSRIFIYQHAFDYLTNEFQLYHPLLQRMKQQYDETSHSLLVKDRDIVMTAASGSYAEDSLSEMVNNLRRTRAEEFVQNQAESERLLDEMTDLDVHRSELLNQLAI
jgi:hypothetical protein